MKYISKNSLSLLKALGSQLYADLHNDPRMERILERLRPVAVM